MTDGDVVTPEEFKNLVVTYAAVHDEIATSRKHISELNKKLTAMGDLILRFMRHRGIDECELQDNGGRLVRRESKRTETLKKEHIVSELMSLVGHDDNKANAILESIYAKRGVETKDVLTRTKR